MLVFVYELLHQLPGDLRLKILGNYKTTKNLKTGSRNILVPSLCCRNKTSLVAVKNYTKANIKVSWSCSILLDFFAFQLVLHLVQIKKTCVLRIKKTIMKSIF